MRLIDADALDKTLDDVCVGICNCCSAFDTEKWRCSLIDHAPTIDAAPVVHGKWVHSRCDRSSGQFDVVKCSRCGLEAYAMAHHVRDGSYCPNCGARMDGDSA